MKKIITIGAIVLVALVGVVLLKHSSEAASLLWNVSGGVSGPNGWASFAQSDLAPLLQLY